MKLLVNILDADEREFEEMMCKDQQSLEFHMNHPHLSKLVGVYLTARYYFLYHTICRIKGHDLVDHGWASPDSGCIDMDCVRCGHSFGTVWLY